VHLKFTDVNKAFYRIVDGISSGIFPTSRLPSRNGDVIMVGEPVTVTYTHPQRRVLFNAARDANPFFHLYESLWMLAGRNDVAPLAYYNSRISGYSDDGETFNGAYGYRWRNHRDMRVNAAGELEPGPKIDQLAKLVAHLRDQPNSRRAVLQMWNVEDDLLKIDASKDVCCNLSVMFSLSYKGAHNPRLDMTVTNRSNDLLWGMLGANVVHFSFLQEYMAAKLGAEVGKYHHFTNNLHVYTANWDPKKLLDEYVNWSMHSPPVVRYEELHLVPLVSDMAALDIEMPLFVQINSHADDITGIVRWREPFLDLVAQPMCRAFHLFKAGDLDAAMFWADGVKSEDWRHAATQWLSRRIRKRKEKQSGSIQTSPNEA